MTNGMRWLAIAFGLSFAVNIFVIGMMIGKDMGKRPHRPKGPSSVEFNLRNTTRFLPPEARQQVREMVTEERKRLRTNYADRRAVNSRINELLVAETVDLVALEAALDARASHSKALAAPLRRVFLEIIPALSQEERQDFVRKLNERRYKRAARRRDTRGKASDPEG